MMKLFKTTIISECHEYFTVKLLSELLTSLFVRDCSLPS